MYFLYFITLYFFYPFLIYENNWYNMGMKPSLLDFLVCNTLKIEDLVKEFSQLLP